MNKEIVMKKHEMKKQEKRFLEFWNDKLTFSFSVMWCHSFGLSTNSLFVFQSVLTKNSIQSKNLNVKYSNINSFQLPIDCISFSLSRILNVRLI